MVSYIAVQVFLTFLFLKLSYVRGIFRCSLNQQEKVHMYMSEHDDLAQGLGRPPEKGGCPGQGLYMALKFEVNIN